MLIERPPEWLRCLGPRALYRMPHGASVAKKVYLTFDDGPIPEVTPRLLDLLDSYGVKGTFFMVGDNVRKYPDLYEEVRNRGHVCGNHTMHHLQGLRESTDRYVRDVDMAAQLIDSRLFRPPHGWLKSSQARSLKERYRLVMYDVVTRDYSKRVTARDVVKNVRKYTRPGSIVVFHDSLKSLPRLFDSLPESIEWLAGEGYEFGVID